MKNTKTMLVGLLVMFIQWLLCGVFGYLLSDATFREALTSVGTFAYMFLIGLLPTFTVCSDFYSELD